MKTQLMLGLMLLGSPALASPPSSARGPDVVEVDLLRSNAGSPKVFVQATLPDGELGLFMVDTGADISVLSTSTAERLGLAIQRGFGQVAGISAVTSMDGAHLPHLRIGDAIVRDLEVAVGVPGVPETFAMMPLDGILGNNVWQHYTLEVDYRANRLTLHEPGSVHLPRRRSARMRFDGGHLHTPIEFSTRNNPAARNAVVLALDTGATDLILRGRTGLPFERDYTEGIEAVYGIGASDTLPPSAFLRQTRRVGLQEVRLGGMKFDVDMEARWLDYGANPSPTPLRIRGLIGYELLDDRVAMIDYQAGRFQLKKARSKAREVNGHEVLLAQDIAAYGDDPSRHLYRARMQVGLGEVEAALVALDAYIAGAAEGDESVAEARVLAARAHRHEGDLHAAWAVLEPLGAGELVDEGELVSSVNGLLLEGRTADAKALADAGLESRPDSGWAQVALADFALATGEIETAREALITAAHLAENPDAHLLRRARVALAGGDHYGALSKLRSLVQLYPLEGKYLWFYAQLLHTQDIETFRSDMGRAVERLHPGHRPIDFLVGAATLLGDEERAQSLMQEGIDRDCSFDGHQPSIDNCVAWYWTLANHRLDDALDRVMGALDSDGNRSEYLDTLAMVHLARGELQEAHDAALSAARLSPEDPYMLWQAERLAQQLADLDGTARAPIAVP